MKPSDVQFRVSHDELAADARLCRDAVGRSSAIDDAAARLLGALDPTCAAWQLARELLEARRAAGGKIPALESKLVDERGYLDRLRLQEAPVGQQTAIVRAVERDLENAQAAAEKARAEYLDLKHSLWQFVKLPD